MLVFSECWLVKEREGCWLIGSNIQREREGGDGKEEDEEENEERGQHLST